MAYTDLLTGRTAAATSTAIDCDGISEITLGIYAGATGPNSDAFSERAGCGVFYWDGTNKVLPLYDPRGKPVVLTASKPTVAIHAAGSYVVDKGLTTQLIGVWGDNGA